MDDSPATARNVKDILVLVNAALATIQGEIDGAAPLDSPALIGTPTAPTAAPGTNTTQLATTAFVAALVSLATTGLLDLKGNVDCSANPNYPAASKGDVYVVSVAGKIGGASGVAVDVGDTVIAKADNAGGTQASVGTSWWTQEHNLAGALLASNNLSDVANVATTRTNLGLAAAALADYIAPTAVAFNAGDYTGSAGMTWTLASGDLKTLKYSVVGKMMTVWFYFQTTSVGGTPDRWLIFPVPGGKTPSDQVFNTMLYYQGAAWSVGMASANTDGTLRLEKLDSSAWAATTDLTYAFGSISFPIN